MNQLIVRARGRAFTMAVLGACLLLPVLAQAQTITTVAGNGTSGYSGDGGAATSASLGQVHGVAVDAAGNRYIADTFNYRIRKVTPAGIITTVAGNGSPGYSGDGGLATGASINDVYRVAVDASGNLYLPEFNGHRIRKVTPGGVISTVVGTGTPGFSGDGGAATSAQISWPMAIALDGAGNLYFTDYNNSRVRKVNAAGMISTVAGNGLRGFSGDGGEATSASFTNPIGLAVDSGGTLYVADTSNHRIRKISAGGTISTVAGNGGFGFSGDGGSATATSLYNPWDVKADAGGNLYIADTGNSRIRKVSADGTISTFAGNGSAGFNGDGGAATSAMLNNPTGLAIAAGSLHIADMRNSRVRKVALFSSCAAEGYSGAKLTLCRQVCEVDQSPSRLTGLIKLYMAIYRSEPPCAR